MDRDEFTADKIKELCFLLRLENSLQEELLGIYRKAQGQIRLRLQELMADTFGEASENIKLAQSYLKEIMILFPKWIIERSEYSSSRFRLVDEDGWDISGSMVFRYQYSTSNGIRTTTEKIEVDWKNFARYADKTNNDVLRAYLVAKKLGIHNE